MSPVPTAISVNIDFPSTPETPVTPIKTIPEKTMTLIPSAQPNITVSTDTNFELPRPPMALLHEHIEKQASSFVVPLFIQDADSEEKKRLERIEILANLPIRIQPDSAQTFRQFEARIFDDDTI